MGCKCNGNCLTAHSLLLDFHTYIPTLYLNVCAHEWLTRSYCIFVDMKCRDIDELWCFSYIVLSSIIYTHTCKALHWRIHAHVSPHIRTHRHVSTTRVITSDTARHLTRADPRVCYNALHTHTHAMCAITITLTHSSTSCTIGFMRSTQTHLLRHVQNDSD